MVLCKTGLLHIKVVNVTTALVTSVLTDDRLTVPVLYNNNASQLYYRRLCLSCLP